MLSVRNIRSNADWLKSHKEDKQYTQYIRRNIMYYNSMAQAMKTRGKNRSDTEELHADLQQLQASVQV